MLTSATIVLNCSGKRKDSTFITLNLSSITDSKMLWKTISPLFTKIKCF